MKKGDPVPEKRGSFLSRVQAMKPKRQSFIEQFPADIRKDLEHIAKGRADGTINKPADDILVELRKEMKERGLPMKLPGITTFRGILRSLAIGAE